eukprot:XP_014784690.1 PREDICTED: protein ZBED8-like [Octopus bimaculoides]
MSFELMPDILDIMKQHVLILHTEIQRYFHDLQNFEEVHHFITNPFAISVVDLLSDYIIQKQFNDLLYDGGAKNAFRNMCCSEFWIEVMQPYPDVIKLALKFIVPFTTMYECEMAFATLLAIKTKAHNKLGSHYQNKFTPLIGIFYFISKFLSHEKLFYTKSFYFVTLL